MKINKSAFLVFLMSVLVLSGNIWAADTKPQNNDQIENNSKEKEKNDDSDEDTEDDVDFIPLEAAKRETFKVTIINKTESEIDVAQVPTLGSFYGIPASARFLSRGCQGAKALLCGEYKRLAAKSDTEIEVTPGNSLSFITISLEQAVVSAQNAVTVVTALGGAGVAVKTGALPAAVPCLMSAKKACGGITSPGTRIDDLKDGLKIVITQKEGCFDFTVDNQ